MDDDLVTILELAIGAEPELDMVDVLVTTIAGDEDDFDVPDGLDDGEGHEVCDEILAIFG